MDDSISRQEEAIAILSNMKIDIPVPKAAVTQRKRNMALDMAIEALDCSESPNSSDTISRQAAIDALHMHLMYRMGTDSNKKRLDDWINGLPSAQPETAKRIVGKSRDGMTLWYQCNMCNEPVEAQDNFCRGCGRRLTDG